MAHLVKCYYCEETFDRDKVPCIPIPFGNRTRYAHEVCPKPPTEERLEQIEKDNFFRVVRRIFGPDYDFHLIETQGLNYINKYDYSWAGMEKTLHWFYEIEGKSPDNGYGGIGIIPYVYDQAKKYYTMMFEAEDNNKNVEVRQRPVYFSIQSPRAWHRPPHLLNLED